jgi:single-strand DNA-binding protein
MEMTDMNHFHFTGRVAKAVTLSGQGDRAVAKFTLIRNQYAGKDDGGETLERTVAIQFTAFRKKGEAIARNCFKGDQMVVVARVENNNYTDKDGVDQYDFSFVVDEFDFGAPGEEKRAELAARQRQGATANA